MNRVIFTLLSLILLCYPEETKSQFRVNGHFDLGNNNLSDGVFLQFSNMGSYDDKYWGVETGYQLGLIQEENVFFNSWYLNPYARIPVGNLSIVLGSEYMLTLFSPDLREINWVLLAGTSLRHWHFDLGNNSRIYRLSRKASGENEEKGEGRISETWNLMYTVQYAVKPFENRWNLMFTLTNHDFFIIQQETNPMINARFGYDLDGPLQLFSELWYKSTGLLNDQVNYFSTFIRIGIKWSIGTKG